MYLHVGTSTYYDYYFSCSPYVSLEYAVGRKIEADGCEPEFDLQRLPVLVDGPDAAVVGVHDLVVDAAQLPAGGGGLRGRKDAC